MDGEHDEGDEEDPGDDAGERDHYEKARRRGGIVE